MLGNTAQLFSKSVMLKIRNSQNNLELYVQEEKGTTEDEMAGWHHRLSGHEFG